MVPVRNATARSLSVPRVIGVFLRRDLAEGKLFRGAFVLDVAYGLVNLLLFFFISQVVHRPGAGAPVGTASYFDFVAVGLAYLLVVQATCTHLIAKVQQQQRSGTLESTVALPVSPQLIAVGM